MNFYSVTFQLNVEVLFSYLRTPSPTPPKSGHLHGVICFPSLVIHFYRRKGWWCCGVFQGTGKGCGWCGGTSCGRFGWLCEQHIRRNKRVSNISELNTFLKYVIFSSCHECGRKKSNKNRHEESNLRPLDFALRCSTTELPRVPWRVRPLLDSYVIHLVQPYVVR